MLREGTKKRREKQIKDNKNRHYQYKIIIINNWTGDVLGLNPIYFYLF